MTFRKSDLSIRFLYFFFFFHFWNDEEKIKSFSHWHQSNFAVNSLFVVVNFLVEMAQKRPEHPKYKKIVAQSECSRLNALLTVDVFKVERKKFCYRCASVQFTDWNLNSNCTEKGSINWSVNWIDVELLASSDFSSVFNCLVFPFYASFGPPHRKLMNFSFQSDHFHFVSLFLFSKKFVSLT